jgi:hypothetical protein
MQTCLELKTIPQSSPIFTTPLKKAFQIAREVADTGAGGIDALVNCRAELIEALKSLIAIRLYQSIVKDFTLQHIIAAQAAASQSGDNSLDGEEVFLRHIKTLTVKDEKNPNSFNIDMNLISDFISNIPLRMASSKYYDYVRDALGALDHEMDYETVEDLGRLFCPMDFLKEQNIFTGMKETLDAIWEKDDWRQDMQAAEAELQSANDVLTELILLQGHISILFDAVVAAFIIVKYGEEYGKDLDMGEITALRSEYAVCVDGDGDNGEFEAKLNDKIRVALDEVFYGPLDNPFDEVAPPEELPEDAKRLFDDWFEMHELFYETGIDYFTSNNFKRVGEVDGIADYNEMLISFMEHCTRGLSGERKRFLRQHFLSHLPYPYDLNTYKKYFLDTYDSLDSNNRDLVALFVSVAETNNSI